MHNIVTSKLTLQVCWIVNCFLFTTIHETDAHYDQNGGEHNGANNYANYWTRWQTSTIKRYLKFRKFYIFFDVNLWIITVVDASVEKIKDDEFRFVFVVGFRFDVKFVNYKVHKSKTYFSKKSRPTDDVIEVVGN